MTTEHADRRTFPVLPLKNSVLFPNLAMPLSVGRKGSISAVEAALATEDKLLIVTSQKDPNIEDPAFGDLFHVGTQGVIKKMTRTDAGIQIIVQGGERVELQPVEQTRSYLQTRGVLLPNPEDWS